MSELRTAALCLNKGGMHDENRIQTNSNAESAYFQEKQRPESGGDHCYLNDDDHVHHPVYSGTEYEQKHGGNDFPADWL